MHTRTSLPFSSHKISCVGARDRQGPRDITVTVMVTVTVTLNLKSPGCMRQLIRLSGDSMWVTGSILVCQWVPWRGWLPRVGPIWGPGPGWPQVICALVMTTMFYSSWQPILLVMTTTTTKIGLAHHSGMGQKDRVFKWKLKLASSMSSTAAVCLYTVSSTHIWSTTQVLIRNFYISKLKKWEPISWKSPICELKSVWLTLS